MVPEDDEPAGDGAGGQADLEQDPGEELGPRLGLATTRQLLEEIDARLAFSEKHVAQQFQSVVKAALMSLGENLLSYRTVQPELAMDDEP